MSTSFGDVGRVCIEIYMYLYMCVYVCVSR